ncbi:hypothetical protein [Streptomyces europaeiscabiei]|uniref:hypothetical protein n=1 Tax=Streptomyces europaeiscabiei TaxID=146819 RepID=UPI0029B7A215|nr:hypothetical protein [Streptomyces europaeiscabiei]MDX3672756.1 hypothetical protein [Streptomyces europaeiscabiei]
MSTLLDTHTRYYGLPDDCLCARAACGALASGPDTPTVKCPVGHINWCGQSHAAYDCPALPADADLSSLWIVVLTDWDPAVGWTTATPYPFGRVLLARLRRGRSIWEMAEGASGPEAVDAWKSRVEAMRNR